MNGDPSLDALGNYEGQPTLSDFTRVARQSMAGGTVTLATDQRGVHRPRGSAADIGAYER